MFSKYLIKDLKSEIRKNKEIIANMKRILKKKQYRQKNAEVILEIISTAEKLIIKCKKNIERLRK